VVVIRAYIDASGSEAGKAPPVLCAAGFVATEAAWTVFEREWDVALKNAGVSQFSMEDCAHFTGEFRSWRGEDQDERRRVFLAELVDIASRQQMLGFARAVRHVDFQHINLAFEADT
jgi:hypothetical protein